MRIRVRVGFRARVGSVVVGGVLSLLSLLYFCRRQAKAKGYKDIFASPRSLTWCMIVFHDVPLLHMLRLLCVCEHYAHVDAWGDLH